MAAQLESRGLSGAVARPLATEINAILARHRTGKTRRTPTKLWIELQSLLLANPATRWTFDVHQFLHDLAANEKPDRRQPIMAWVPDPKETRASNLGKLIAERHAKTYDDLHRWSIEHRDEYWSVMIRQLGIVFRRKPTAARDVRSPATRPVWLPGAALNIAESCFPAPSGKTAILYGSESNESIRPTTYGELKRLSARVANGLDALGLGRRDRIALFMPMTPEAVAIYLGTVLSGRCVVGIADAAAPPDFEKRARIADVKAVFTIESYLRDGKEHAIYEKVIAAKGPRAIVVPAEGAREVDLRRSEDLAWREFLGDWDSYEAVACEPYDFTNILFSSGTTKDPKAIPWTHTTPIKSAADAYLHHDVRTGDVLAWPTSFGWMMGPWLTYASLVNGAAMALYVGGTARRAFGEFVSRARVTMLGVVPKLVRSWKSDRVMEGLDWSQIRLFSSTAEPSSPDEMLYLMFLAGYRPVIEYCGGTEIGGAYITGTVVQPASPALFSTAAMGLDFVLLEDGRPADRGEVFLVPPSIGLSNELLNYDHDHEYFEGVPLGPRGETLRRHGDRIERLSNGYYRHRGRIDDMINVSGVKTSSEEIRSILGNDLVYDAKPVAVDLEGTGQHRLVIYVVPRDLTLLDSPELRERLRKEFQRAIKENLNPLLAHVEEVVLVSELPQTGPGKTRTGAELRRDYETRTRRT